MPESALPLHCPRGHELGPGQVSLSWAREEGEHRLYCLTCESKARILLADGAVWQVLVVGWGWVDVG